jgi:transposase
VVSEFDKGRMVQCMIFGMTLRAAGEETGYDHKTVSLYWKRYCEEKNCDRKPGQGAPRKTNDREDREIVLAVKRKRDVTINQIKADIPDLVSELDLSGELIRRRIHEAGLHSVVAIKKPFISEENRRKRLKWAREHLLWSYEQWNSVIWSDESMFELRADIQKLVWKYDDESLNTDLTVGTVKHQPHVMVWGCFSGKCGVGDLTVVKGKVNADGYIKVLRKHLLPSIDKFEEEYCIFQQDNAPIHNAASTTEFLLENEVNTMNWPPQSPDLNPIENLWGELNRVTKDRQPRDLEQLEEIINKAWHEISDVYITDLIESMHERCKAVIDANGMSTRW